MLQWTNFQSIIYKYITLNIKTLFLAHAFTMVKQWVSKRFFAWLWTGPSWYTMVYWQGAVDFQAKSRTTVRSQMLSKYRKYHFWESEFQSLPVNHALDPPRNWHPWCFNLLPVSLARPLIGSSILYLRVSSSYQLNVLLPFERTYLTHLG